jgi:hypothetical protein
MGLAAISEQTVGLQLDGLLQIEQTNPPYTIPDHSRTAPEHYKAKM